MKMGICFIKNLIPKSWSAKFFPSPQTWRQVSAYVEGLNSSHWNGLVSQFIPIFYCSAAEKSMLYGAFWFPEDFVPVFT